MISADVGQVLPSMKNAFPWLPGTWSMIFKHHKKCIEQSDRMSHHFRWNHRIVCFLEFCEKVVDSSTNVENVDFVWSDATFYQIVRYSLAMLKGHVLSFWEPQIYVFHMVWGNTWSISVFLPHCAPKCIIIWVLTFSTPGRFIYESIWRQVVLGGEFLRSIVFQNSKIWIINFLIHY